MDEKAAHEAADRPIRQVPNGPTRILLVDDEPEIRAMLESLFMDEGWVVEEAGSAEAALQRCRQDPPDILVLDNKMPGQSGMEFAKQLRAENFNAPIVLFSAYLNSELKAECTSLGLVPVDKINWLEVVFNCRTLDFERRSTPEPPISAPVVAQLAATG